MSLPRLRTLPVFVLLLAAGLAPAQTAALRTEVVVRGLENPWGMAFIDGGRLLVTERPGRLRVVQPDGRLGAPVAGVPAVDAVGQGGLLDVAADRDFARNRQVFLCYSEAGPGGNSTALARARLSADATKLEDVKLIFSQRPKVVSRLHFGCRIAEAPDGTLWLLTDDRDGQLLRLRPR